jgi:oligopeptide/dipeptide ABC transporter ATP-binding protein
VSIQAQIINMLMDLQGSMDLSYLFIAHDLSVVEHISTRVAVMYLGRIVEQASKHDLYRSPRHPYTQALLSAVPVANPRIKPRRIILEGDVPTPINPPSGCRFHPRCRHRMEICEHEQPEFREIEKNHFAACHWA